MSPEEKPKGVNTGEWAGPFNRSGRAIHQHGYSSLNPLPTGKQLNFQILYQFVTLFSQLW